MIFQPHANKTLRKKGCALGFILKVRVFETLKWPVVYFFKFESASLEHLTNPMGVAQGPQKSFHSFLPSTDSKVRITLYSVVNSITGKSYSVAFN